MTAMYVAVKRQLLLMYSQKQGHNTESRKPTWKNMTNEEKSTALKNARDKNFAKWDKLGDTFFLPDYWLTFLLCSLPMNVAFPNKKMTLDCLVPPEVAVAAPMNATTGGPVLPKVLRRAERSAVSRNLKLNFNNHHTFLFPISDRQRILEELPLLHRQSLMQLLILPRKRGTPLQLPILTRKLILVHMTTLLILFPGRWIDLNETSSF